MFKNKYVMWIGCAVLLLSVLAAGGWAVYSQRANQLSQRISKLAESEQANETTQSQLDQDTTANSSAAAGATTNLGVSNTPQANDLGQLNLAPQSISPGPTSASTGSQNPDPSTFGQYDKYKDDTSALFGDIQVGNGAELTDGKQAAVYYKGWLTNGTIFDQSRTGNNGQLQPFIFTLGAHQVITGWEQAITGMKVGGSRLIIVPSAVGYGATGQGAIPPNSTLVFEVQLLAVQ